MSDEVRIVDPVTGGEKGRKLERFELIPVGPLTELARLYGAGAAKYEDRNWERGFAWSLSYAALMRHATQFWGGESIDVETHRHHLASVIFHAMALMEFEAKGKGTDDRPREIESLPDAVNRVMRLHEEGFVSRQTVMDAVLPPDVDSPYDVAPDPDIESQRHYHDVRDHSAATPMDHLGCVPCHHAGCLCHHPIQPA